MSRTIIETVPDLGGFPPSTAVRVSLCSWCFSRSRAFFRIKSANFDPSLPV
uniref:Uncharacterized protein n=1 Tax=Mastacembelus armatus TaxID=205130 RepID=A0A7N8X5V0_9TELE